jgi:hypothetical protein
MTQQPVRKQYLSVHSCLGYDEPYLREWIEFHRIVGVERFFLYVNRDPQAQRALLQPYVQEGVVVLYDWPGIGMQFPAMEHCLARHREDSRWIAFIDTDEFLFSPEGISIPGVLTDYEEFAGLGVNQFSFGTSGHAVKPDGLVIENYLHREDFDTTTIKSIINPMRARKVWGAHHFGYFGTVAVDVRKRQIPTTQTETRESSPLRINHYWTRSLEELELKWSRLRPDTGEPYDQLPPIDHLNAVRDEAILRYLPQLKKALGQPVGGLNAKIATRRT